MKLKNVLISALSIVLVAAVSVGGTLAYLTMEAGDESNVFSIGNINVSLNEDVAIFGEGGEVKETENGAEYTDIMPGDYLKKEVTVTNNGKTPAYVAVTVKLNNARVINKAIDDVYEKAPYNYTAEQIQAVYDFIFDGWGLNYGKDLDGDGTNDAGMRLTITGDDMPENVLHVDSVKTIDEYAQFYSGNWFGEQSDVIPFDGYYTSNMGKYELKYIYYAYLPAGESTTLFSGLNVPAAFNNEQIKMFDGLKIDVEAKAIQADNMAVAAQYKNDANGKAKTAFAILAGDIETPDYSNKPTGYMGNVYTSADGYWGEHHSNATQSHVIKFFNDDTYMGETSLNNINGILDGDVYVTWSIKFNTTAKADNYWSTKWAIAPTLQMQPNRTELWVDGMLAGECNNIQMNGPDNLNPIVGAVTNADGKILGYIVKGEDPKLQDGEIATNFASSADALIEALEKGNDVLLNSDIKIDPASMSNAYGKTGINVKNGQTIDGAGHTIDIKGAGGTWDSGINTTGGVIKNLKVTGSFRGIFINHNSEHSEQVVLENVVIDGTTYTVSCDQGKNQTLLATNSTFNGWTSFAGTLGSAKFVDCNFGEGNGYAFCRPYAPTEFVGCDFEEGFRVDPVAAVTFENCTIAGEPLTESNLSTLVTSISNASVK